MQQLLVYKIFTLDIPHGNFRAHYDVDINILESHRTKLWQ